MGALFFMLYNSKKPPVDIQNVRAFMRMKNRGLDDTQYIAETTAPLNRVNEDKMRLYLTRSELASYTPFTFISGHHRKSVNDTSLDGVQPFVDPIAHQLLRHPELRNRPKRTLMCNGEIYNYRELVEQEKFTEADLQSSCDVEVIMPLYIKYGLDTMLSKVNGDFSFVLTENLETFDMKTVNVFVGRDAVGARPLYMVRSVDPSNVFYVFTSELKGLPDSILHNSKYEVTEVPPGTYWSFQNSVMRKSKEEFIRYSDWNDFKHVSTCKVTSADPQVLSEVYTSIREKLEAAVISRYELSDRGVGVLLSGGFDSSIVLSILVKHLVSRDHDFVAKPLHVFTVGYPDSKDILHAKLCVEDISKRYGIELVHHVVLLNRDDIMYQKHEELVTILETFDPFMIRRSLPLLFLYKYIQEKTDVHVLLTGEGLDELCGHAKLFERDDVGFQRASVRLVKHQSKFKLLVADKLSSHFHLELRHPFVDTTFIKYMLSIHPRLKRPQVYRVNKPPVEKYIVRKSFDDGYLDEALLWRPMQGVETRQFEGTVAGLESFRFARLANVLAAKNVATPKSDEARHFQKVFVERYGHSVKCVPKFWDDLWEK